MWENRLYMPDDIAAKEAESYLEDMMARRDSCGGVVECVIEGLPAGVGEPVFDKLDAALAKAMMSIGAVKGVEIGDGLRRQYPPVHRITTASALTVRATRPSEPITPVASWEG